MKKNSIDKPTTGRPKKEIDQEQFEKLCGLQCTQIEICGWFNVDDKTLSKWCQDTYNMRFSEIFKLKREKGKIALRRFQWQLAEKNATMAIWLGKQYLDQHDEPKQVETTEAKTITVVFK